LNERIIELIDIAKDFGALDTHLETIKILSQIKKLNNLKAFEKKEV
jgi:hypothetical protein